MVCEILPVFCFDPRIYHLKESRTDYDTRKTGLIRAKFQLETAESLRSELQKIGNNLLVSKETPEMFLPQLLNSDFHNILVYQKETCYEEVEVERRVLEVFKAVATQHPDKFSIQIETVWGSTLFHLDDLQHHPTDMSEENYTQTDFRKLNKNTKIRPLLLGPDEGLEKGEMPFLEDLEHCPFVQKAIEYFPTLQDFGFTEDEIAENSQKHQFFQGGEISGL